MRTARRIVVKQIGSPPPISIRPYDLPSPLRAGEAYPSFAFAADGPSTGINWTTTSGSPPPSMTVLEWGQVPGGVFPMDAQGSYAFTVEASAAGYASDSALVTIDVDYPYLRWAPIPAAPSAIPDGVTPYAGIPGNIRLIGGNGVFGLVVDAGYFLPAGLSLTAVSGTTDQWQITGACTGVPGQSYTINLLATSGDGQSGIITITIFVQALAPLSMQASFPALANYTVGAAYGPVAWSISGGTGPYTVSREGPVPTGITSNLTNAFEGTPTDGAGLTLPGNFVVFDSSTPAKFVIVPYTMVGNPAVPVPISITMPSFATNPVPGSDYADKTATVTGATGTVTWSITGTLPQGMSFANGVWATTVIGSSAAGLTFSGSVTAADSGTGTQATRTWSMTVDPLSTAFVGPSESATPAMIEFDAATSGISNLTVSSYLDLGSVAAADVTVSLEAVEPLQAGVSLSAATTGAGTLSVSYDESAGSNTQADADVRLVWTYDDPTVGTGGGGAPLQFTEAEREADWAARKAAAGVHKAVDFRASLYPDVATLVAASKPVSGRSPNLPQYEQTFDASDWVTGGQSLALKVYEAASAQGGCFAVNYDFNPYDYRPFWTQVVMQLDDVALGWASANPQGTNAEGGGGNKIMYWKNNASASGQVYFSAGNARGGFISVNRENNAAIETLVTGMTGASSADGYHLHTAIDNGTPTGNDIASRERRYGVEKRNVTLGVTEGSTLSSQATVPLIHQRAGYPRPDALAGGSFMIEPNRWFVVTIYIDPAPRDIFPTDGSGPGGRIARVVAWMSHYGEPARVMVDSFNPLRRPGSGTDRLTGHYQPAPSGLPANSDRHFLDFRFQNYLTERAAEPGRPTMTYKYAQGLVSFKEIKHPHQSGALPQSPFGPCVEYPAWPGGY